MIGKIINVLFVIVAVVVVGAMVLGGLYVGVMYVLSSTILLGIIGVFVALLIFVAVGAALDRRKLDAAVREYDQLRQTAGSNVREVCPHKQFQITQQDLGVVVFTTKWCKVCGKNLGPATLKKSIFGNSWQ